MKKAFAVLLFLACFAAVFAQEKKMSTGIGFEWDMNSRHNFAGGALLTFDYKLPRFVTLGFMLEGSSNFSNMYVIEPAFLFRAYFLENEYRGLYFQSDLGVSFIFEDGEDLWIRPLAGAGTGYRFLLGSSFYVEPFGRLGFPFAFGLGVIGGLRF